MTSAKRVTLETHWLPTQQTSVELATATLWARSLESVEVMAAVFASQALEASTVRTRPP